MVPKEEGNLPQVTASGLSMACTVQEYHLSAMWRSPITLLLLLVVGVCAAQNNISGASDVTVDIVLTGARTVPPSLRNEITRELNKAAAEIGSLQTGEFVEYVQDQFARHGYMKAQIRDPQWHRVTGNGQHRHAQVTINVTEGAVYRLSSIAFSGNKAFGSQSLRAAIPMKNGEVLNVEEMRLGLKKLSEMYCSKGYINFTPIPNTEFDNKSSTVKIIFDLDEGEQFRVGTLRLNGNEPSPGEGKRLLALWATHIGQPYDCQLWEIIRKAGSRDTCLLKGSSPAPPLACDPLPEVKLDRDTKTVDIYFDFPDPQ
jgi:hypothetical protein